MKDLEGRKIVISENMNDHKLILGRSGSGKTYYCNRDLENIYSSGKRVLVLDYSGSYTPQEMTKANFAYFDEVEYFSVYKKPYFWFFDTDSPSAFTCGISETLTELLAVKSYIQNTLLKKAVEKFVRDAGTFNLSKFFTFLEGQLHDLQERQYTDPYPNIEKDVENISFLLSRLFPYSEVNNLTVSRSEYKAIKMRSKGIIREDIFARKDLMKQAGRIHMVQLSEFPEKIKRFLAEFLSLLLWKEIKLKGQSRFEYILLDEFQNLSLSDERAVYNILREGRKYGISAILSTQYISHYDRKELRALDQAEQVLMFQPAVQDVKFCMEVLKIQHTQEWKEILLHLERGYAVLSGKYTYQGGSRIYSEPIIVRIE